MFPPITYDLDENDRPTWPPAGTSSLCIEDKMCLLFYSASWRIEASVDGKLIAMSSESRSEHSWAFKRRWARKFIRTNYALLCSLGVNAERDYINYGGRREDLGA